MQRVVNGFQHETPLVLAAGGVAVAAGPVAARRHVSTSSSGCPSSGFSRPMAAINGAGSARYWHI